MLLRILKWSGVALAILIAAPIIAGLGLKALRQDVPPPGQLFDVGGYNLHINCVGIESSYPTIVFESGSGIASPVYYWFQRELSSVTRICVYDRAGLGWSEESDLPRDAATVTSALRKLLDKAGVDRPFVYAGHSIASLYMLYYVRNYPGEVAGLAFMDPSHPNQNELLQLEPDTNLKIVSGPLRTLKLLIKFGLAELINPLSVGPSNDWVKAYPEEIQVQLKYLAKQPQFIDAYISELTDFELAARQAAETKTLGELPIVVVTASEKLPEGVYPFIEDMAKLQAGIFSMHKDTASLSSNSEHYKISSATHMSLVQAPENASLASTYLLQLLDRLEAESASSAADVSE